MNRLLEFRAEHPCRQIDVAGVRWEVLSCGQGEQVLLLLPGGLRVAETAFAYVQLFEDVCRVIVPTYPPVWSMEEITTGIAAILDAEWVQGAHLLGQSYGGLVAQVFVRRYPERVKKLVLSSTGPLAPFTKRARVLVALSRVMPLLPERLVLRTYKRALLPVLSVPGPDRQFWEAYLDELVERRLTKADVLSHFRTLEDAMNRFAFAPGEQSTWGGEVLIIGADDDAASTAMDRSRMQEIYARAQVHLIPGAGHTVAMSEPERYATAVKGFLGV
jgi:pimeloyl-ACP methyl ester carboxylesterase